jgi:hypothetical protein
MHILPLTTQYTQDIHDIQVNQSGGLLICKIINAIILGSIPSVLLFVIFLLLSGITDYGILIYVGIVTSILVFLIITILIIKKSLRNN